MQRVNQTQHNHSAHDLLSASKLSKSYAGREVVRDVSVSVFGGEVVGLLGPNGAGKTTTFYMIVGLVGPDRGSISLNNHIITAEPMFQRARLGLGYLPQEPSVFRKLSVRDNILAILETMEFSSESERASRLEELLSEFNLHHLTHNLASSLSGGERRRVEIARALARSPKFMLLDEPFAGIDPIIINELQEIILRLKEKGIGVLITDHNVRETLGICDRAYILADGHVVEEGSPQKIASSDIARKYYLGENFAY